MAAELRAVSPENRGQLVATQRDELKSMEDRFLKPHSGGRATEVDWRRMAFSDPFGGQEDRDIQKQIKEYLKTISEKVGGGARLN